MLPFQILVQLAVWGAFGKDFHNIMFPLGGHP